MEVESIKATFFYLKVVWWHNVKTFSIGFRPATLLKRDSSTCFSFMNTIFTEHIRVTTFSSLTIRIWTCKLFRGSEILLECVKWISMEGKTWSLSQTRKFCPRRCSNRDGKSPHLNRHSKTSHLTLFLLFASVVKDFGLKLD